MPFDGVDFVPARSIQQIDAVIDLLATPDKWCKGALRSHNGRHCIRGAVRAIGAADLLEPVILRAIGETSSRRFGRIEAFNDHPNTTHPQVLAVLGRARDAIAAGNGLGAAPADAAKVSLLASWRSALLRRFTG